MEGKWEAIPGLICSFRCKGLKRVCKCPDPCMTGLTNSVTFVLYSSGSLKSQLGLTGLRITVLAGLRSFCSGRVNQAGFSRELEAAEHREMSRVLSCTPVAQTQLAHRYFSAQVVRRIV